MTVNILNLVKAELGTTTLTDAQIQANIDEAAVFIKNYCRRTDILDAMAYIWRDISIVNLTETPTDQEIKSIKEGDTTINFGGSTSQELSIFADYKSKLNQFRKLV
jgi:hypothetical protein